MDSTVSDWDSVDSTDSVNSAESVNFSLYLVLFRNNILLKNVILFLISAATLNILLVRFVVHLIV